MEQRSNHSDKKHEHPLVMTVWRHSCSLHGEHIVVYGTDCPNTANLNARTLYEDCVEACDWTGQPKQYTFDLDMPGMFGDKLAGENEPKK